LSAGLSNFQLGLGFFCLASFPRLLLFTPETAPPLFHQPTMTGEKNKKGVGCGRAAKNCDALNFVNLSCVKLVRQRRFKGR